MSKKEGENGYNMLAKALLYGAVANLEPKGAVLNGGGESKYYDKEQLRRKIIDESSAYIQSSTFERYCNILGLDVTELRQLPPAAARKALRSEMARWRSRLNARRVDDSTAA